MKKIFFDDPFLKKNYSDDDNLYIKENQIHFLSNIYNNIDHSYNKIIIKDIKKKFSSYKSQDKLKKKFDLDNHITYSELLEKLYQSKLKCFYCNTDLFLIYKNKNETSQWSLERFNNNLGHYNDNTCISCLKCNLQRRNDNFEYFKMGKQMKIIKHS